MTSAASGKCAALAAAVRATGVAHAASSVGRLPGVVHAGTWSAALAPWGKANTAAATMIHVFETMQQGPLPNGLVRPGGADTCRSATVSSTLPSV